MAWRGYWRLAIIAVFAAGCSRGPSAPLLTDSHVYQNAAEGFRFLIPDGWVQTASSALPPGNLAGPVFLVRYTLAAAEPGTMFTVVCMDESQAADLETYHRGPSFHIDRWTIVEPRKQIAVNDVAAERMVYRAGEKQQTMKLVTCFRQHGRVYSFVGLYRAGDEMAREQIERTTGEILWNK